MVHYIRFLSSPQVVAAHKKALGVSVVLAITTDLGDTYLAEDVDLVVRVVEAHSLNVVVEQVLPWKGFSRALKASVICNGKYASRPIRVHVTTSDTQGSLRGQRIPRIMDVWSSAFELIDKTRSEPVVARDIVLSNGSRLQIWEETGDSIARHVWDASLGFIMYIEQTLQVHAANIPSRLHNLVLSSKSRRLQVLELGTGCGTVGIAFAQLCKSDVILTDLIDAMDILHTNIQAAKLSPSSTTQGQVLDWGADLHASFSSKYDLILVSDCIYNPDSSVHLVNTLLRLMLHSPDALILVGFKRRHSGDDIFFDHMNKYGFDLLDTQNVDLPHIPSDYDAYAPIIEFHIYAAPTNEVGTESQSRLFTMSGTPASGSALSNEASG